MSEADIKGRKVKYTHPDGSATIYAHFVDGMEIWEYKPKCWKGWKLCRRFIGEREVY